MLGLAVGVAVFMAVLAAAVRLFCAHYPVVNERARIDHDKALSSTRAIATQSFAKLACVLLVHVSAIATQLTLTRGFPLPRQYSC